MDNQNEIINFHKKTFLCFGLLWYLHENNIRLGSTDSTKINRPGYNIRIYWPKFWQPTVHVYQIFLKKLLEKIVVLIFTLLLASFASKSVNYSRPSDPLNYLWKSTNHRHRRKMSSISEFFRFFKDSLCRE